VGLVAHAVLEDEVARRPRALAVVGGDAQSIEHLVVLLAERLRLVALEHHQLLLQRGGRPFCRGHHNHSNRHEGGAGDERRHNRGPGHSSGGLLPNLARAPASTPVE